MDEVETLDAEASVFGALVVIGQMTRAWLDLTRAIVIVGWCELGSHQPADFEDEIRAAARLAPP